MAFVVPAAVVGTGEAGGLTEQYVAAEGFPLFGAAEQGDASGESLRAMCYRLLGPSPLRKTGEVIDVSSGLLSAAGSAWGRCA